VLIANFNFMSIISYQILSEGNGIDLEQDDLVLYYENNELARAKAPKFGLSLPELLSEYQIPLLFPNYEFAYKGLVREIDLTINVDYALENSIAGHIAWEDFQDQEQLGPWFAERVGDNAFLLNKQIPEGQRDYTINDKPGYGFLLEIPQLFNYGEDAVICHRVALQLEKLIYRLEKNDIDKLPYRCRVNNIFSAQKPMWNTPLPLVKA
jgi:hypothetical protein